MIISDCHIHSHHSGDSSASMVSMIESAIEKKLKTICFTEHMDFDFIPVIENGQALSFEVDMPAYLKEIKQLANTYTNNIQILTGIELGIMPHLGKRCSSFVNEYDLDFIIASTHLVDGLDPYYPEYFQNKTEQEAYRGYFEATYNNILAFDNFDSYGHLDYIVRYGANKNKNYTYDQYSDILDLILKKLVYMGKALEINTGGYKKGLGEPHPQTDILKRYRELGGELITIGSDAHCPEHIRDSFLEAFDVLKSVGFKYYSIYEKRCPVMMPL